MELKINSEKIKAARQQKAWSQDHLAQVSGVGLRTIQRIENTGISSYDSIMAISAVLDVPVKCLIKHENRTASGLRNAFASARAAAGLAVLVLMLSIVFLRGALADHVSLAVGITMDGETFSETRLVTEEGKEAIVQIADSYRISVVPLVAGTNEIHMILNLMRFNGTEYETIARPRLVTLAGEEVEFSSDEDEQTRLRVRITPSL